ncbi:MAG TPA: ABC transporter ATP-binding protein [Verrucomicrobiae bacterium]|nr:ABC transporter ATP-binding protein [Verrucomicrobiae bacterium]
MTLLEVAGLKKSFSAPDGATLRVIDVPEFAMTEKTQIGIRGRSGTGKTTFLHLLAGILKPDAGAVRIDGVEVSGLPEAERDRSRANRIGYIFQTFNLLPAFTALENVLLGMAFGPGANSEHAEALLRRVGLGERLHYRPRQLSSGQQQRVAVARALANRPRLVLADEPTGNLDAAHAQEAIDLIRETCRESGAALLLVSHDREILQRFDQVVEFESINRTR